MNKVLLAVCILSIVFSLGVSVSADSDGSWLVNLRVFNAAGTGNSAGICKCGTGPSYIDGFKPFEDSTLAAIYPSQAGVICTDLDPNQLWIADRRQSVANAAKIWNLKLQVNGLFPDNQALLKVWVLDLGTDSFQPSNDWSLTLQRKNGDIWDIVHTFNGDTGTDTDPVFSTLVDVTKGATYDYRLVYAPVPEPSSILALIAGLGTLGSITWRRRK